MSEEIDQLSFASILAGVKKMRQDYEVNAPAPAPPAPAPPQENTPTPQVGLEKRPIIEPNVTNNTNNFTSARQIHANIENNGAPVTAARPRPTTGSPQPTTNPRTNRRTTNASVHSYTQVQVAQLQKGNPLLESPQMKLTPWAYNGQILLDYYINATVQVLFLSLKYHKLRPEYVWRRLEKLKGGTSLTAVEKNDEALRVLLVVVDIDSPQEVLRKLLVICIKHDLTMVVAWSFEEAGNYVAALKLNEMARTKVESSIQGVKKTDYNSNIVNTLTTVRAVNKTDVANLLANCKSFKNIVLQLTLGDGLLAIQGLGGRKVTNLNAAFSEPFIFNKRD